MPDYEVPYNSEAERWLLSCLMIDPTLIPECISRKLTDKDFYNKNAQLIYQAIMSLYYKNMSITPITVWDELQTMKVLDVCWWVDALYQLNILELNASAFYDYINIVIARSKQRQFIREIKRILPMAYDTSSDDVMSKLRVATHSLLNWDLSESKWWQIGKAYDKLIETLKAWWLKPICNTWLKELDYYTKGFWETAVWVIWARSGMWKSTFVLQLLINACLQWAKCCMFSLEVNEQEISEKIMSNIWWIPSQAYNSNVVDAKIIERIEKIEPKVKPIKENLYVYDKLRRYEDIVSQIYALAWQWVKIFCIDHLLLIKSSEKRQNKVSELWDIVNGLKGIAQELDICIILVSQFNRRVDDRIVKEPQLSDFNWASDIENIANVAIGLQRMEYLDKEDCMDEDKNTIDVYILKNRKNPIANLRFKCDMSISKIYDEWEVNRWNRNWSEKDLKSEEKTVKESINSIKEFDISDYEIESEY